MRVHPTGTVTVFTGSHSHGQGHETTFAQVVAGKLGIPVENVEIVHGDTGRVPFGMGTYGSRSLAVGGTAIVKAVDKIIAKGKKIAAHLLEAADTDIEFENGEFKVKGTDKKVPFGLGDADGLRAAQLPARQARAGPERERVLRPDQLHLPVGQLRLRGRGRSRDRQDARSSRFIAVDDFGNIVNPMIVAGQVHGGIAQGLGQAMMEGCVYDTEVGPAADRLATWTTPCRAPTTCPASSSTTTNTPCTPQPAGRQGLRRGRRDRLAAGLHQRADRCAGRAGHRHAGHGRARLARRQRSIA